MYLSANRSHEGWDEKSNDADIHKQSGRKENIIFFSSSALHLIYDFKTYQHGIVFLDGAEVVE